MRRGVYARNKEMTRLFFAAMLFLALILPSAVISSQAVSAEEEQEVDITIAAALEALPPENLSIGSGAPQAAGEGTNIDSGEVNVLYLWSNTTWDSTIVAGSETLESSDGRDPVALLQPLLYAAEGVPSSTVPVGTPAAVVNDGPRNTSNNAQEYSIYFRQPISWGDEAGEYDITLTHGLSTS